MGTPAAPIRKRVIVVAVTATVGVLIAAFVWWGRADEVADVTVHGRLTVDGEPLPGGLVIFYPDAGRGNHSPFEPRARTDRRGGYQLRAEGKQGIVPGWYRVAVVPPQPGTGEDAKAKSKHPVSFDRRYENPDTSGLAVHVRPYPPRGGYELDLARPHSRK